MSLNPKELKRSLIKRYFVALTTIIMCWSCGVTRHTPQGSYFIQSVKIVEDKSTPKEDRIPYYTFEGYIRQSPNKRFLGTNFYVWVYNLANPDKDNSWNRFKRKIGQEPNYLDVDLTRRGAENLKFFMNSQGYYSSDVEYDIDTTSLKKRAKITYQVKQGEPYVIDSLSYEFRDTLLRDLVVSDTVNSLIRVGSIFNATTLDNERTRIAKSLQNRGYYNFTVNNIEYVADTLSGNKRVGLTVIVKQYLTGYNNRGVAQMDNSTRYKVNSINIIPNFDPSVIMSDTAYLSRIDTSYYRGMHIMFEGKRPNVKKFILRQAVPIYPNTYYSANLVDQAYKNIMSIGYFKSAKILFQEDQRKNIPVDTTVYLRTRKDSTIVTNSPIGYLDCNILCTPALKQSVKLEVEASTTSSFYGASITAGYQNRNIFRGAESFDLDITTGYEYMKAQDAVKRNASEFGIATGLSFPRFIIPLFSSRFPHVIQPRTKVKLSVNYQDRPYYRRTLSSASWDYSWRTKGYSSFSVSPVNINMIDMASIDKDFYESLHNEYLRNSYKTQLIAGLSFSYTYNNQFRNISGNATVFRTNVETSGNLIDGLEHLFDTPANGGDIYHVLGIPYAQYARADMSLSRKIKLGEKSAIAGRLYAGLGVAYGNSTSLPYDRFFYAGGSNSMRGWAPRTLGPGSIPEPTDDIYPNQVGDMKLEANIEFRFPIWESIHGATFFDLGNIWFAHDIEGLTDPNAIFHINDFYKQLGLNTGLGLRLDIQFAILRLDWGLQLHNPNLPEGDRWIKRFQWKNSALNFGVGYPF